MVRNQKIVLPPVSGELVAQFKFTVLLLPNGPLKITGLPVDTSVIDSQYSVEDEELKVRWGLIQVGFL